MITEAPMPQFDDWLKTPDGITCCCGKTEGEYLRNRLWYAYMAGWNDARRHHDARPTSNSEGQR